MSCKRTDYLLQLFPSLTYTVYTASVRRQLSKLPAGKAAGPGVVSLQILRAYATQLCGVLHQVSNMNLSLQRVPVI